MRKCVCVCERLFCVRGFSVALEGQAGRHVTEHRESTHTADAIRLNGIRPITFLPAAAPEPPGRKKKVGCAAHRRK